ncbi:MAG: hypothetical protein SCH71_08705 [Desulfobulbaceae bacterium]|nr:hypothetical protein [Desulfobulbaceae bacterium]
MIYRKLIVTYVAVLLVLGIPLLVIPNAFIKLFGADLTSAGEAMSAFYGASMLGVAWMMWKAKRTVQSEILEGLMQGNLIIWSLSFVIAIIGQIQSTFNVLGLMVVGLSIFFSGWYGYIRNNERKKS